MGVSALFINLLKFNGTLWGSFLSGEVSCICAEGGQGVGAVFIQKSPWKVSMMLIPTWVRSRLSGVWEKWGVTMTRWAAAPFLPAEPGAKVSHRVLVSLSSPTLFFCVGCLFFEKLTQDHSCNVSFY